MIIGQIVATSTLIAYCRDNEISLHPFITRFIENDWGDLGQEDKDANYMELREPAGHVLAKYTLPTGEFIYIETCWNEEDRHTTLMFPSER
jgi:hypothetical protein